MNDSLTDSMPDNVVAPGEVATAVRVREAARKPRSGADRPDRKDATAERRSIVTGKVLERGALLRFALSPEGRIVPDVAGRLPGRGLWSECERTIVSQACEKGLFARAARRPVHVPPNLPDTVEHQLLRRCQEIMGLARRAGAAVAGHDQVRALLAEGKAGAVLIARDGAADGRARMAAAAAAAGLPVIRRFDRSEIGQALGRGETVHAALRAGGLARRVLEEARRLAGFRPGEIAEGDQVEAALTDNAAGVEGVATTKGAMAARRSPLTRTSGRMKD
ncbi:MAG: RNA-binding protein [Alphaproteobacteria bacterium]